MSPRGQRCSLWKGACCCPLRPCWVLSANTTGSGSPSLSPRSAGGEEVPSTECAAKAQDRRRRLQPRPSLPVSRPGLVGQPDVRAEGQQERGAAGPGRAAGQPQQTLHRGQGGRPEDPGHGGGEEPGSLGGPPARCGREGWGVCSHGARGPRNSFENGRPPNGAWEAGFSCSGSAHLRPKGTLGHPAPHKTGADAGQLPTGPPRPSPWGQGLEGTRCVGFCWLSQGSGNGGGGGGGGGPGRARPVTACAGVSVAAH